MARSELGQKMSGVWEIKQSLRGAVALAMATVVVLCGAQAASASPQTLASMSSTSVAGTPLAALPNAAQKLTAYDGYVVFSQLDSKDQWSLMVWHAGSIKPLPVPARSIPFDAEAGSMANGRPAVVFSKCTADPPFVHHLPEDEDPTPEWSKAVGCRIYELPLPAGTPKLITNIHTPGASDSTPAIWRGDIAFASRNDGSRSPSRKFLRSEARSPVFVGVGLFLVV
jgi:hypothetical protein